MVGLLIGSFSVVPYLGYRFEYYPGDLIDARLNMYLLEHGYMWLAGLTAHSFLDAPFYYPVRRVITYSDNLLGALPFYIPWRWLRFDRETSFQIWVAVGFLLNYLAAAWVFKKMRFHWTAVLFGAYVFALSHVALAHIGHSQLHYRFAVPLAWYFLYRFLEQFSWKDLLACLLFVAWQFYCGLYVGYFLVLFLTAFALVTIVRKPIVKQYVNRTTTASVTAHMIVLLSFVAALAAVAHPYMEATRDAELIATRRQEIITMLPRPVSYLVSKSDNNETGWLSERLDVPMKHEHVMFVGAIPWICVLFLLLTVRRKGRNPWVIPAILAMLGIVVLTLYVNGMSLYFALMQVPGVVGIRAVTRVVLVLLLPFSIAVAQVVHLSWARLQSARTPFRVVALAVSVLALLLENHTNPYRVSKAEAQERVRALGERLPGKIPRDAILAYLHPAGGFERQPYDLDAMLLAQDKGIFTVNGYSSRVPKGYRLLRTCADLKLVLNNTAQQDEVFALQDAQSQIVVLGTALDAPCAHLNAPASIQTEPLPDNVFRAKLEIRTVPAIPRESELLAEIRVTNQSDVLWRAMALPGGKYAIRVGCRWINSTFERAVSGYDHRFDFPYDVEPGATVSIVAAVAAPAAPGSYHLECDAVQELVHWFHEMGSRPVRTTVVVTGHTAPFEGFLDRVDNEQIAGWVWNNNHPNSPVRVDLYNGNTLLATVSADLFREDLLKAHKGNGAHGFALSNPVSSKSGQLHTIRAFVSGANFELAGSPKTFTASR